MSGATVLVMAGGTGGHIFPGLAVADALTRAGAKVHWLGAAGGMECERVPQRGYAIDGIHVTGLRGKGLAGWLKLPFRLTRAVREARAVLRREQPGCAVSFGGYAAGPGGLAARLGGVPLVVHEQNRIPGMTNRTLAKMASVVMEAFPGTFPESTGAVACGNPVRDELLALPAPAERWAGRQGPARLLVTGGSQGARALNRAVPQALALWPAESRPQVRHQAGHHDVEDTRARYAEAGIDAQVTPFIEDMAEAYGWADAVACRSGALTVSELAAVGLGAVLVPFPHAVDDHQTANAAVLVDAGAAVLCPESSLEPRVLADALQNVLADRQAALAMAEKARAVAVTDAAERVARACLEQCQPRRAA
ncbi:undecaprenyldiphospho-muramoylpentapeptide beta-N-acetylglucosaminyltransferase [Marinihelvus fidelis]|uniref:UDP-N-acetylglucosamine--N-acetylmuramyl-(pentapeptide) pyrophosphoryl-undecaprenol N-acetylglucosamine transferase n=1 Tax=Marinihelvus fidelis TaxID=2613842 RepID=A0A5N0T3T7_9GAMM|nr:undecaprenyldiphospho-muramoylpentapeptide beta-N-acetylglucosaminyltransferase [Marinihelvus fidelis]KAA9129725.1 undecaprenyldiphospho-muramoylpentapeptide beta-N-acetylglucosaminyltransferase [Marinihelvus fidelis]